MENILNKKLNMEASHYELLEGGKVRCDICGNNCIIDLEKYGRCKSRFNKGGKLFLTTYGCASSIAIDPIEKKPLYHFHPGTSVFSIGGWGCNFSCIHCQNWEISQPPTNAEIYVYDLSPEKSVQLALDHNCSGICWTYNEPAIFYEYTLDSAKLAKKAGLYTAYITNGFLNELPLREIAPYLDAYRVDFKGFSDELYKNLCRISNWEQVYKNTVLAKNLGIHIEVVTNIVPGFNDDEETLRKIAKFTVDNIGRDTPWHVSRFFPNYQLKDIKPTPLETIDRAVKIGEEEGLMFVYKGNCQGKTSTECPKCGMLAIERDYPVRINVSEDGKCIGCGFNLNIRKTK